MRKLVLEVSDKVRLKPACSATETSQKIKIALVASLEMILSNKGITKALIRLSKCAGWSATLLFTTPKRQVFSYLFFIFTTVSPRHLFMFGYFGMLGGLSRLMRL